MTGLRASLCGLLAASSLHAQVAAKIAVSIDDDSKQFASAFSSAFRQLGDVQVVSVQEDPDYVLSGVVLCQPNCSSVATYSASLRLYKPFPRVGASSVLILARSRYDTVMGAGRDSSENDVYEFLEGYEKTIDTWVAQWGRQRYEQSIRELVRSIDGRCFEPVRAFQRAVAQRDTSLIRRAATDPGRRRCS